MSNISLYQLTNEYQLIQMKLLESDFDEQTIADTLEGASGDVEAKSINVAMFIRNLETSAEAIKQDTLPKSQLLLLCP